MVNILLRELKGNRRMLAIWTAAMGGLNVLIMAIYPSFALDAERLQEILAMYPEGFLKLFSLDRISMADPVGFYATEAYFMILLFGGIFAALLGSGLLAKEEDEKTIEFLLARPVTRGEVLAGKALAYIVYLVFFNAAVGLATLAGFEIFVPTGYSRSVLVLLLIAPLFAHLAFASLGYLTALFWVRRRAAYSVSIGLVLASYFINVLATLADRFSFLRPITPFHHVDAADIVVTGALDWGGAALLLVFSALILALVYGLYRRRDITV